jgi:Fe-S-cluster containining protein
MKIDLAGSVRPVEAAMRGSSEKTVVRRLNLYLDRIKCVRGCASCCSRMVYISVAEALVMQETMSESGRWSEVRRRCLDQRQTSMDSNPVSWFKMNVSCPVLDPKSKECLAYEVRPTPCSTHFVESDPRQCNPWETKGGGYLPIQMNDIHEEFMRTMESCVDGYGILAYRMPMPVALLFAESVRTMTGLTLEEVTSLMRSELR